MCLQEVMNIMKTNSINQLPVIDRDGTIKGMAFLPNIMSKLLNRLAKPSDPVARAVFKKFVRVDRNDGLGHVSRILEQDPFVLVVQQEKKCKDGNTRHVCPNVC